MSPSHSCTGATDLHFKPLAALLCCCMHTVLVSFCWSRMSALQSPALVMRRCASRQQLTCGGSGPLMAAQCSAGPIFFTWLAQLLLPLLLVNMVYEKERGCEAQRGPSSLGPTAGFACMATL